MPIVTTASPHRRKVLRLVAFVSMTKYERITGLQGSGSNPSLRR